MILTPVEVYSVVFGSGCLGDVIFRVFVDGSSF